MALETVDGDRREVVAAPAEMPGLRSDGLGVCAFDCVTIHGSREAERLAPYALCTVSSRWCFIILM